MRLHLVLRYVGVVLLFNALFLLISAGISAAYGDDALPCLLFSAVVAALFGLFPLIFVPHTTDISNREGLIIVVASWLISCLAGALPYSLWGGEFSFTNAWFESVSGYTTTGSSILTNVEGLPMGLLFWRAATHWIGGIGIIIFVLAVMPFVGPATMVLYKSEISSLAKDNFRHRTRTTLQILLVVYLGLTGLETIGLMLCGFGFFDALTHAFATVATGGFSTKNLSIAYFNSVAAEMVIVVFMVLSGLHFGLLFSAATGNPGKILRSSATRYYIAAMLAGTLLATADLHSSVYASWGESLRYAVFQVVSLGTSTGFANADSGPWPPLTKLVLIYFTLQCACSGSTSGGIKADRLVIFWQSIKRQIQQIRHPKAVVVVKVDDTAVSDADILACLLFISVYLAVVFASTLLLSALGVDLTTAFSGSAACMGNVGPGFGQVSSLSNFSALPAAGKWVLTLTMLFGRLEIFGLMLFLMVRTWR